MAVLRRERRRRAAPAATRASRSASECTFGTATMPGAIVSRSLDHRRCGPATRAPSKAVARRLALIGAPSRVAPSPGDREIKPVLHRREHRARDRAAVLDQRDRDRPVGAAGEIGARAVDRIDHPEPARRRAARGRPRSPRRASRSRARAAVRRSRSRRSTAMSASVTGESPCLVQLLELRANGLGSASAPASRTIAASSSLSAARAIGSGARNGQSFHPHGRRIGAVAEFEIVGRRRARRTCR